MIYSLNEIDAQSKKAARGIGLQWGYAEEIGKAVRWLSAFELPGSEVLASCLSQKDTDPAGLLGPGVSDDMILKTATGSALCPILTGAYVCDITRVKPRAQIQFEKLGYPLLLMPYIAQIAGVSDQSVIFQYAQTVLSYGQGKLDCNPGTALSSQQVDKADCTFTPAAINGKHPAVSGRPVNDNDWEILDRFASRTYVPATDASRRGAGPTE